jgi:hypothetical protein
LHDLKLLVNTYNEAARSMNFVGKGKGNKHLLIRCKEDEKMEQKQNKHLNEENEQQHSMVCNDQLFFQELRIAAEEAERDHVDTDQSKA